SGRHLRVRTDFPWIFQLARAPPLARGLEYAARLVALPFDRQGRESLVLERALRTGGARRENSRRARHARGARQAREDDRTRQLPRLPLARRGGGAREHAQLGRRLGTSAA